MKTECCNQDCNQGRDCPLRKKTLTDQEIMEVAKDFYLSQYVPYDFVDAILKKVNEK